ncbi:MAG: hypothetical protein J0L58_13705 [Burkholderiales bacterium]|nr:hypothetical protein [Burkholderiales bacterium]
MKPAPGEADPAQTAAADLSQKGMQRPRATVEPEPSVKSRPCGVAELQRQGLHLHMNLTSAACPMAESPLDEILPAILPMRIAHQLQIQHLAFAKLRRLSA